MYFNIYKVMNSLKLFVCVCIISTLTSCKGSLPIYIYHYVSNANDAEITGQDLNRFFKSDTNYVQAYSLKSIGLYKELNFLKKNIYKSGKPIDFDLYTYDFAFVTQSMDTIFLLERPNMFRYKNFQYRCTNSKIKKYLR